MAIVVTLVNCSFCGSRSDRIDGFMIQAPGRDAAICETCISDCLDQIAHSRSRVKPQSVAAVDPHASDSGKPTKD